MTFHDLLSISEKKLQTELNLSPSEAKRDVEDIAVYATKWSRAELIARGGNEVGITHKAIFDKALADRITGKPVQYITNSACFFGYDFFVNESCLIPRVDSEVLIENALKDCTQDNVKVLDLCCGSGCLGLSFAKQIAEKNRKYELTMLDISTNAIQIARLNAQKLDVKASFMVADILQGLSLDKQFDVIFCNPPYIETDEIDNLDKQVKNFEPHLALDGGEDGLKFYRAVAENLKSIIAKSGKAYFEIGYNQGKTASAIFTAKNFDVEVKKDYGKKDRCLIVY
ncbi:MAG: peptide chain release factor N(5)-glutamine methyltransferase [Rickettsiales bacterium]|nr:peptide chain release factor N(5)-glutamine methyltransferase [Rickettsiales bacterium]